MLIFDQQLWHSTSVQYDVAFLKKKKDYTLQKINSSSGNSCTDTHLCVPHKSKHLTVLPQQLWNLIHSSEVHTLLFSVPSLPSDCKTCQILMILTQNHLVQNSSETQMTILLWKTCHLHPNALPGVTVLISGISSLQHEQVLIVSFLMDFLSPCSLSVSCLSRVMAWHS